MKFQYSIQIKSIPKSKQIIHLKNRIHQIVLNFLESDNPGSTDSEVRKILTLHIPITEYDTLGSESDNEMSARAVNAAKYRPQRGEYYDKS